MGSQLWTSSITGYRRKGTRFSELRAVLAAGVVARAIMEPLRSCAIDADALDIKQILEKRGFDRAGVKIINEGSVIGYVERNRLLRGAVKDFVQPVSTEFLVSDATPINVLLSVLGRKEYLFVLVGAEISGIVTRADLNKPMVRVYLFGLISLLEMHLRFWVRPTYADESWSKLLKKERVELAYVLQRQRMTRNEDITLLDCLQFCDTRDLFTSSADVCRSSVLKPRNKPNGFCDEPKSFAIG